jgi:hypothetical protein
MPLLREKNRFMFWLSNSGRFALLLVSLKMVTIDKNIREILDEIEELED